jgi:non-ribosomal peptide synthetase component F
MLHSTGTEKLVCVTPKMEQTNSSLSDSQDADRLEKVWQLSRTVPAAIHESIHSLVGHTVASTPEAIAIRAWNGELTYRELDKLSSNLAKELIDLGVGTGMIVPLCFEKSV